MNIWETLKKPFFTNTTKVNVVNPEKVTSFLGTEDDIDISSLIRSNRNDNIKPIKISQKDRILRYRNIANSSEASVIIDEIINEFYSSVLGENPKLLIHDYEIPDALTKKIDASFSKIMGLIDFKTNGQDLIKSWYVDGHLFLECGFDDNTKKGITNISKLDPINLTKIPSKRGTSYDYTYEDIENSYFGATNIKKVYSKEQVVHVSSGKYDPTGAPISFLDPAVKVFGQMQTIEDMLVVYRITRGTEKRAIKVNIGNMTRTKGIQYMTELVNKFRYNKSYDSKTGTVTNDSHIMSLTEDMWLPTNGSTKDIEIDTLQGGIALGELTDLEYFRNKFIMALRVPTNRFNQDSTGLDVTATEVDQAEVRFSNFVGSLRQKFNDLFIQLLKRELISTKSMTELEFREMKTHIIVKYPEDSSVKQRQVKNLLMNKIEIVDGMEEHIGVYFSKEYVNTKVLMFTDEEIKLMKEQMKKEKAEEPKDEEEY